jgi:Protein of unknown function (DUF3489)
MIVPKSSETGMTAKDTATKTTLETPKLHARVSRRGGKPRARLTAAHKRTEAPAGRKGSKTAKILRLLRRSDGASLAELTKATGWQPHSMRGFLSGAVKAKMRLKITSIKRDDGERAYRVPDK